MRFSRKASAHWEGTGMEGKGTISTESTVLKNAQYSFKTRFENGVGTNPEELIGAAHSGCFTMKLSFLLSDKGFVPEDLSTVATVTFEDGAITKSHLDLSAKIPGITEPEFQAIATEAKETCPVSKLLNAEITIASKLIQ